MFAALHEVKCGLTFFVGSCQHQIGHLPYSHFSLKNCEIVNEPVNLSSVNDEMTAYRTPVYPNTSCNLCFQFHEVELKLLGDTKWELRPLAPVQYTEF